jgi:hypothetical protein
VPRAQTVVEQRQAEVAALDTRADRIHAEPLDRPGLEQIADEELAASLRSRSDRHAEWTRRLALNNQRLARLGEHDSTADDLAAVAAAMRAWPDAGAFPTMAAAAEAIEGVVADSRAQRTRQPRTDDLHAATSALAGALQQLQTAASAATTARDGWARALEADAQALRDINDQAPQR